MQPSFRVTWILTKPPWDSHLNTEMNIFLAFVSPEAALCERSVSKCIMQDRSCCANNVKVHQQGNKGIIMRDDLEHTKKEALVLSGSGLGHGSQSGLKPFLGSLSYNAIFPFFNIFSLVMVLEVICLVVSWSLYDSPVTFTEWVNQERESHCWRRNLFPTMQISWEAPR